MKTISFIPFAAPSPRATARGSDFLGGCPSPLRMGMRDDLADPLRKIHLRGGARLKGCAPMGAGASRASTGCARFA